MRALMDPEGLRYSSFTQMPSTLTSGVSPIASRTVSLPLTRTVGLSWAPPGTSTLTVSRPQPGLDLVGVRVDPLLRGVVGRHAVLGDVGGHDVLVVVAPLELLDQVHRRRAGV